MKQAIKFKYITLIIALLLILFSSVAVGGGRSSLAADTAKSYYTNVLDDLKKDEDFNASDYPAIDDDFSLRVIQIAESMDRELFIYVYQPAAGNRNLRATSISMSLSETVDGTKIYGLTFINSNGVFAKYKVSNFTVQQSEVRYYNITSLYRDWIAGIDKEPAEGQTVSEVGIKVAQLWTLSDEGDKVNYEMLTVDVITITQKFVGYCVYNDGLTLGWGTMEGITKAYFIAFDTDRPIDKLISADITFFATKIKCKYCVNNAHKDHKLFYDFSDPEYIDFGTGVYNDTPLTVTYTQKFSNEGGGNWAGRPANKYTWNRIRSTKDFISDNNNENIEILDDDVDLSNTKWVLNFYEAQDKYKSNNVWFTFVPGISAIKGVGDGECELNSAYDVSVLRLEFETDGKHYNLGVVDNKQSGSNKPYAGTADKKMNFWQFIWDCIVKTFTGVGAWWQVVISVVAIVVVVVAFILIVIFLRFVINGLRGKRGKRGKK